MVDPDYVHAVRSFAQMHVSPIAHQIDRDDVYPLEFVRKFGAEGFTKGILAPEYGGHGDYRKTIALFEEIGYASCAAAVSIISILQAQTMIWKYGSHELKELYIPKLNSGMTASYSLTEESHGSDIRALETKAYWDGKAWVLNGEKSFVTSGEAAELIVLLAETEKGVSVFSVTHDMPGVEKYVGEHSSTFGLRNGAHVNMKLEDVRVPASHLIGEEGRGVKQAVTTMAHSRTCTAAIFVGIARAAFDGALRRARGRVAFDNTVLSFQGIQWYFAEMFTEIEAARSLTYRAADALNENDALDRHTSVAKLKAGSVATDVSLKAMQICGAWGTSDKTPFSRFVRDSKTYEIGAGSSEIMKNTIAKYLIRELDS
ncbi:acyl-CoA dehydrogenase family protein [Roseovarius sp. MMSF_3281]|uniref:acyl-CoA dehydrogenase family protein n=1 Tax=Roseovarius sp. MMSF_3281 TaxID=3046694 RepID=UPI00273EE379|nr:acyl-CoA dehydrogenase [Roseovarius sp. MMSF_3281]